MTHRRRGYALIEMVLVISLTALLLSLCAGMIHLLLKLDRAGRSTASEAADLARLARDFRADAHASQADPDGRSAEKLTLAGAGGRTVEYLVRPRDLLRTVREGDKVRAFETYRTPPRASVRIEVGDGPRPFATVILDRPAEGPDNNLYRDYRIEAELARDRRLNPRAE